MGKIYRSPKTQALQPDSEMFRGYCMWYRKVRVRANTKRGQRGVARSGQLILVLVVLAVAAFFGYRHLSTEPSAQAISQEIEPDQQLKHETEDSGPELMTQTLGTSDASEAGSIREEKVADETTSVGTIAPETSVQSSAPPVRATAPVPDYDWAYARDLVRGLTQFSPPDGKLLPSDIEAINRSLEELKGQGPAAVAVIEEYLGTGADVDFSAWSDTDDLAHSRLRLALMDTLGQIGGWEALDLMVRTLPAVIDPVEIAALAEGLEGNAPGVYRSEIVDTTREVLALALEGDPKDFQGLAHLFGVIQAYGDETMAADLDSVYRGSNSAWAENALMALSRLPGGQGVPYLVDIANEMSADPNRHASRYRTALQMLAQASREDPRAESTLVQMVGEGQLSTSDLATVAATLGGNEYQLVTAGSEIAERAKAPTLLNGRAPETWTDADIEQRLGMVDQILRTDPEAAATEALTKAQERLLTWKDRPMINGIRSTSK